MTVRFCCCCFLVLFVFVYFRRYYPYFLRYDIRGIVMRYEERDLKLHNRKQYNISQMAIFVQTQLFLCKCLNRIQLLSFDEIYNIASTFTNKFPFMI
jgi:hypothetical protein